MAAPSFYSRFRLCTAIPDAAGRLYLSSPEPFTYHDLPDNKVVVTSATDTWEGLADMHFRAMAGQLALINMEPSHLWWILCDFQPEPQLDAAFDPTLRIPQGSQIILPSVATVLEQVFSEKRRAEFEG